jgi:hypothetical protein
MTFPLMIPVPAKLLKEIQINSKSEKNGFIVIVRFLFIECGREKVFFDHVRVIKYRLNSLTTLVGIALQR